NASARLKEGTVVILLKNLDIPNGLCKGTRLQITNCLEHTITYEIVTGPRTQQQDGTIACN
ncbi:hypothetical protein AAVH_06773, partial [Aphelenchoides avenae]